MDFVVIFGPPAVGKMTVGEELCKLSGFKLFHNHMAVEPVLGIFPFGSPPFGRLVNEFRRRVIEEAADAALPGLVFTYVWGLELPEDTELIGSYVDIVRSRGGRTRFVELYADLDERLERNTTELRLDRKPSKRDLEFSRANLLEFDRDYVMNTDGSRRTCAQDLIERHDHVRIDNTRLTPAETAALILRRMPQ
ncbi:AAA family ATPase [Amycolatopsis keratiniphila]|uniref:AAA family ATPase n=1 Tax=Amycolatopsis keratiniphila TaxID=129921 RepID=UPI00341157CD